MDLTKKTLKLNQEIAIVFEAYVDWDERNSLRMKSNGRDEKGVS